MNSQMVWQTSPEDRDLSRLREELVALQSTLADRELFLTNLRAELTAFEGRYLRQVGTLYAKLDDWSAKLSELAAEMDGSEEARCFASEARAQAEESYAASHGEAAKAIEFAPMPELKKLFRDVVNQVHPDRAATDADRAVRERLMAEANLAYKRQDANALLRVLAEYRNSPEAEQGEGSTTDRQRIACQMERICQRLAEIEAEIEALSASEIAMLMAKVVGEATQGRDLLDEMTRNVLHRIMQVRAEYEDRSARLKPEKV
jgi:hypothetical protein